MTSSYIARKKYVKNKNYLYAHIAVANFGWHLKNKIQLLFMIYINDLLFGIGNWRLKFAHHTNIFTRLTDDTYWHSLQAQCNQTFCLRSTMAKAIQYHQMQSHAYW